MSPTAAPARWETLTIDPDKGYELDELIETEPENPFYDVGKDAYYYDAVLWAVDEGITAGTTNTTFSPTAPAPAPRS